MIKNYGTTGFLFVCFISLNDNSNKLIMVLSKVFWERTILHLGTVWAKGGENVSRKGGGGKKRMVHVGAVPSLICYDN